MLAWLCSFCKHTARERALKGLLQRLLRMGVAYKTDCSGLIIILGPHAEELFAIRVSESGEFCLAGEPLLPMREFLGVLMDELKRTGVVAPSA